MNVIKDLVETLEDGKEGFSKTAEKLRGDGHTDLANRMMEFSEQRSRFAGELRTYATKAGEEIDESGSAAGALHRGWISLKDALTGDDAHAVLAAAESGEDHAVEEYKDALNEQDIDADLRELISRQAAEVKSAHDEVRNLRDRFDS
jgi:uncharacterized protein (TIGR02284 family)